METIELFLYFYDVVFVALNEGALLGLQQSVDFWLNIVSEVIELGQGGYYFKKGILGYGRVTL